MNSRLLTHRLVLGRQSRGGGRVVPVLDGGGHPSRAGLDVFEGDGRAEVVLAARSNCGQNEMPFEIVRINVFRD